MRSLALLALLAFGTAGCNLIFKAVPDETGSPDAPDGPVPATTCPPPEDALVFVGPRMPIAAPDCTSYSHSDKSNLAVAECSAVIKESAIDGQLVPSSFFNNSPDDPAAPKVSPEGDQLFLRVGTGLFTIEIFDRVTDGSGSWKAGVDSVTGIMGDPDMTFSAPSSFDLTGRRIIVNSDTTTPTFTEYSHGAGAPAWVFEKEYTPADLDVVSMEQPNLSADGLHLVFRTREGQVFHSARKSRGDKWPAATLLDVPVTGAQYPFLTSDCARLYVNGASDLGYIAR